MHLLLLFSLIYFHFISFDLLCVIILWVFISFVALLLLYYYFYGCIKCIYVSWSCVTPLLSWARSTLKELSGEQKHWVTKCHLDVFSKCCFYDSFSHCCHCCLLFFSCYRLFFLLWHMISSCQWMQTLSRESLNSLRKHFPWFHGVTDSMTGGASLHHLSDGYFYINLPPIFMCLQSVVLMYLSKKKILATLLYTLLFCSLWPRTHDHKERGPRRTVWRLCSTYMLLLERELLFMWVYSKVTNCSLVCMYTFVIEMYCKKKGDIFNKNINLGYVLLASLSPQAAWFCITPSES